SPSTAGRTPGRVAASSRLVVALTAVAVCGGALGPHLGARLAAQTASPQSKTNRARTPRIAPRQPADWTDTDRQILGPFLKSGQNAFKVCLKSPAACRPWIQFTAAVGQTLPVRDRELLILRTAWLCGNEYTFGIHTNAAKRAGFSADEIERVTQGPSAGWTAWEAAVIQAADGLHAEQFIDDATWTTLSGRYSEAQLLDTMFTVGQYTMISMMVRSAGFEQESGTPGFP
ncbi:MAG: carboxymuconolactone decarboxylase family protein, partial [Vicinamibacterales bacterium]